MFRNLCTHFAVLVSTALVAQAQQDLLTIADVVASISARHPALAAYDADVEASRAMLKQAEFRPNPGLDAGIGYKDTDADSGYAFDLGLSFPIEREGKREARMGIAESDVRISEAAMKQLHRDIELQVRTLSYEYLTASADTDIALEIAERSRAMIDLLKQRPAAGPVILLELRVIEGSLVEFQQSAREFQAKRDAARSSLNVLLGRADDEPLVLNEELTPPANRYAMSDLLKQMESSPSLMRRLAEIERAAFEAKAAVLEAKPDMAIGPYVSREDAGEAETTIGLVVSIPLTWRNRNQGGIVAAQARQAKAEAELAVETLSARSELAQRLRNYESAVAQVEAIPANQVASLHDAADLADRQYRLGAIPVQLFLDMQREFLNVQLLRHNALLESMMIAAELEWLAGTATVESQP